MNQSFDVERVRAAFPSLSTRDDGRRRIHLDNPAGTQVPRVVADAVSEAILHRNANLGGAFTTSREAGRVWEDAHSAMATMLGGAGPEEILIGPNMTSLTFHLSRTIGRDWGPGDEVVLTRMDHEGNVGPWMQIAADRGATVRFVPFSTESWQVEPDALRAAVNERTRLVALSHASNMTGSVNRIAELVAIAREAGALTYVDSVQYAPHGAVDVAAIGCDFLACSAYKFFGPHLGIVWGRRAVLDSLVPYKLRCSTDDLPGRLETGTPQIELLAGLTATVDHLAALGEGGERRAALVQGFEHAQRHELALVERLLTGIATIDGATVHGITDPARLDERVPTVSFTLPDIEPRSLAEWLAAEGIFVWHGHNYAWGPVHQLGIPPERGVLRIGAANYNTLAEIDETVACLVDAVTTLRQGRAS